ncbi:MAG: hypothetical protein QNJ67_18455 [Kiloniellales bacterium]|nr:hypothetical protein [Kiloniellales bacterium]
MRLIPLFLAGLLLAGCGWEIKPGEGSNARREIPPGAGLLTGDQGEFVIFRVEGEPAEGEEKEEAEEAD